MFNWLEREVDQALERAAQQAAAENRDSITVTLFASSLGASPAAQSQKVIPDSRPDERTTEPPPNEQDRHSDTLPFSRRLHLILQLAILAACLEQTPRVCRKHVEFVLQGFGKCPNDEQTVPSSASYPIAIMNVLRSITAIKERELRAFRYVCMNTDLDTEYQR